MPDIFRGGCSQPTIGLSTGIPNGGVIERTEGGEGVCSPTEGATVSTDQTARAPGDSITNQRIHMQEPMALATYMADDGLVKHQWEERPLVLRRLNAPV